MSVCFGRFLKVKTQLCHLQVCCSSFSQETAAAWDHRLHRPEESWDGRLLGTVWSSRVDRLIDMGDQRWSKYIMNIWCMMIYVTVNICIYLKASDLQLIVIAKRQSLPVLCFVLLWLRDTIFYFTLLDFKSLEEGNTFHMRISQECQRSALALWRLVPVHHKLRLFGSSANAWKRAKRSEGQSWRTVEAGPLYRNIQYRN